MEKIRQMCLDHFNEPILVDLKIARLIGYAEDEYDCYLILKYPDDKGVVWHSAVGGYTLLDRLKGQDEFVPKHHDFDDEVWDDFKRLDSLLTIRGVHKEKSFLNEDQTTDER